MKTQRAVLPLALSAAFMLGCQEQGPDPVAPDGLGPIFSHGGPPPHPPKEPGPGGDGPEAATLTFSDGMVAPADENGAPSADLWTVRTNESAQAFTDNCEGGEENLPLIQMNFTSPGICFGLKATGGSVLPNADEMDVLKASLTSLVQSDGCWLQIDRAGLTVSGSTTSDDHHLIISTPRGVLGPDLSGRIQLGSSLSEVGPVTVKWVSSNAGMDVFEFTGPVKVGSGYSKKNKDARHMACNGVGGQPNLVTVTYTR